MPKHIFLSMLVSCKLVCLSGLRALPMGSNFRVGGSLEVDKNVELYSCFYSGAEFE